MPVCPYARITMNRLGIIGFPIAHSLSPVIYNAAFPAMGIDATFEAWLTPAEDVGTAVARLRQEPETLGMSVTVPHKEAVQPFLDAIEPTAKAIGAVNCITKADGRLTGHNTDQYGFIRSLREGGCDPAGMHAVILGAGGSAHTVAYALAEAGVVSLAMANRSPERLKTTLEHAEATSPRPVPIEALGWQDESVTKACRDADLIVNTTSVGMQGGPALELSPLRTGDLKEDVWVFDLVYRPLETPLLLEAREAGARPIAGLDMLIYQGVRCVELWTGREPSVDIMRRAAKGALGIKD
ncbi:MAG: shikimate dehydrogenase [Dehalococcoidia bacterium]|nr:shikimate dehydrogenase [Dehalococcoidia bacterium]